MLECGSHKHILISGVTHLLVALGGKAGLPTGWALHINGTEETEAKDALFLNTDRQSSAGGTA